MSIADRWSRRALRAGMLLLTAALLATSPAQAAQSPPAPYWSVHLETHGSRDKALAVLKTLGDAPAARAERRKSGWLVRVGAWNDKAEAEKALAALGKGRKEARVLQIENPVEWLLASGEKVAPPGAATPAAAAATAAPAAADPVAAATAPAAAAAVAAPASAEAPAPARYVPPPVTDAEFKEGAVALDTQVRRWLEKGAARGDGYVYGMDVAPLLLYSALRKDSALYEQLLAIARPLILTGDAATEGFVLWRHKAGTEPEVSGAPEGLWLARALWAGHRLLKRADDRALALKVLDGYARHATGTSGTWLVHKYYAFGTQSLAGLSVLSGYHPDFLEEAEPQASAKVKGIGRKSYQLLQRATTPSRLLAPLVKPDLNEVLPGIGLSIYAPNGLVSLEDSCYAAEGAVRGNPQLAKNVLEFAAKPSRLDQNGRLLAYYDRRDGHSLGQQVLSTTGYACLARVAAETRDRASIAKLKPVLLGDINSLLDAGQTQAAPLYGAGPLLLAADALNAL